MSESESSPSPSELTRIEFERILQSEPKLERYILVLFITGTTSRSTQAVETIRQLCEEYLPNNYELEVVDIYQDRGRLAADQIVAAPTLIKKEPFPEQRFVGNLDDRERVLVGLNLKRENPINWLEI